MSDVFVALSTTKHIISMENTTLEALKILRDQDFPVCISTIGMSLFGFGKSVEREELFYAQVCMENSKVVHVDPLKRSIFIGNDPNNEYSAIVDYTDDVKDQSADDFFTRWEKFKSLHWEFQVRDNLRNTDLFCLKGLWAVDHWHNLEIAHRGCINVTPSKS